MVIDVPHLASKVLRTDGAMADRGNDKAVAALGRLFLRIFGVNLWSCCLLAANHGGGDSVDGRKAFGGFTGVVAEGEFGG